MVRIVDQFSIPWKRWGEELKQRASETHRKVEKFVEKHFAAIAFVFSISLLLFAAPGALLLGSALGAVGHYYLKPNLRVQTGARKIPILNATIAIVGAMAALIRLTPAGFLGGAVFRSIPLLSSLVIGSTGYRIIRSF